MKDKNFKILTPYELGLSGEKKAIPFLIEYLKNGSTNDRRLAASAINKLSKIFREDVKSAIPHLIKNLSFDSPQLRQYTLKALLSLPLQKESQAIYENIAAYDDKKYNRIIAEKILDKYHNNQTDKSTDDPLLKSEISPNKIIKNTTEIKIEKNSINPKDFSKLLVEDFTMDEAELKKIFLENLHKCSQKEKFKNHILQHNIDNAISAFDLVIENKTIPPNVLFEVITDGEE